MQQSCWLLVSPGSRFLHELAKKNRPLARGRSVGCKVRFYWKKSDIELATAEAPGM
jgi:hypothetical protein